MAREYDVVGRYEGGHEPSATVSCGVAGFRDDGTAADDLLLRADARLHRAKREGKNRVVWD